MPKILIIDDDPFIISLLPEQLNNILIELNLDFEIMLASSGIEGLQTFNQHQD